MSSPCWRHAVVDQIYVRSFADRNGDGERDLPGIRSRLPYLRQLGVDAVWLNPCYPSTPLDDHAVIPATTTVWLALDPARAQ